MNYYLVTYSIAALLVFFVGFELGHFIKEKFLST